MRITLLSSSYPRFPGDGNAQFIEKLARAYANKSQEVTVVTPRNTRAQTKSREIRAGVRIIRFPYFFPGFLERLNYEGGILTSLGQCKWAFLQIPFFYLMFFIYGVKASKDADVLHANWIPTGFISYLISRVRKIPYVVTVRGSDKDLMRYRLTRPLSRFVLRRARHITTTNSLLRKQVMELGISHLKVTTLYNGIEMDRFKPGDRMKARAVLSLSPNHTIILYVGDITKQKGISDLAKAVRIATKKHKDLRVLIAGKGSSKAELEHILWNYGISHFFHFLGPISHGRLHKIFQASDIFVLPSYSEGRPNVVLEAMSSGLCLITTSVGSLPEIITDKENGRLVKPRQPEQLAKVIEELLDDPTKIRKLGERAREWSLENNLSWEQSAELYIKLYEGIHAKKRAPN